MRVSAKIVTNLLIVYFLVLGMPGCAKNTEKSGPPEIGDKVPHFSATDDQGNVWNSKDVVGSETLVVYFYPAAMTGG